MDTKTKAGYIASAVGIVVTVIIAIVFGKGWQIGVPAFAGYLITTVVLAWNDWQIDRMN